MLIYYRLARGAGHSIFRSLTWALLNRPLPENPIPFEQREAEYLARVAELDRKSRDYTASQSLPKSN
jgi:hypothetical protein